MRIAGFLLYSVLMLASASSYNQSRHNYGFIENKGQVVDQYGKPNSDVLFLASIPGKLNVQLKSDGFSYEIYSKINSSENKFTYNRLDIEFVDFNNEAEILSENPYEDYINFYTSGFSKNEGFQVRHYSKITYKNIYPNIDLVFTLNSASNQLLKYDFIVRPNADISSIKLRYKGFQTYTASEKAIQFNLNDKKITENIPASWWEFSKESANVGYTILDEKNGELTIGFSLKSNQLNQTLIIDPEPQLAWSTYYGDTLIDIGTGIITDNLGYVYATGYTQSFTNLATTGTHQDTLAGGMFDVYITKFKDNATRIWATYYGGSGWEESTSIIVDTLDNISITGFTDSPDGIASDSAYLEILNAGTKDAFIAKFNKNGLRIWSTYFGGDGDDIGNGIDTDFDGLIFVTGSTVNSNFGISSPGAFQTNSNGLKDAFVVKFDTLGYPIWSTYFGGSANEDGNAITEEDGNIYITGQTNSLDLLTTSGAHQTTIGGNNDAFITAFSSTGNLIWSTYFGGDSSDVAFDIEIFNSKIYCVGETKSQNQIANSGAWSETLGGTSDAFVTRFDTSGVKLWSTYFGKSNEESAVGVSMEFDGGVYISGTTNSDSLALNDVHDTTYNGAIDVFLAKFSEFGTPIWCTYFGDSLNDVATGLDVYGNTNVYLTGFTNSENNFATWSPFFQPTYGGGDYDAFITKFTTYKSTPPCTVGTCGGSGILAATYCIGDTLLFVTSGGALGSGANWVWYQNSCDTLGIQLAIGDTLQIIVTLGTTHYFVRAESINNATPCTEFIINGINKPIATISLNDSICPGQTLFLNGSGGINYSWSGPNSFSSTNQNESIDSISSIHAGQYILTVDNNACADSDTAEFFILPPSSVSFTTIIPTCINGNDGELTAFASGNSPFTYYWTTLGSNDSSQQNLNAGVYYIEITDGNNCSFLDSAFVSNPASSIINVISTPAICISATGSATIQTTGINAPYTYWWPSTGDTLSTISNLIAGYYLVEITNSIGCTETNTAYVDLINNLMISTNVIQHESCVNTSDGIAEVTIVSGTSPFIFSWNPGLFSTAYADSLNAGNYFITVEDANGCLQLDTITIIPANPIQIYLDNLINPYCSNNNGSIEVSATGGFGNLIFTWNQNTLFGNSLNNLDSGTFNLTVSDEKFCAQTASFNLIQVGNIDVSVQAYPTTILSGEQINLEAFAIPDTGLLTYSWWPLINCTDCPSGIASPTTSGFYTVTVTNENGCNDTASIYISVLPCIDPFVPTIFSPNGDGLNDTWEVLGSCIASLNVSLYDRWGELIFSSQSQSESWNGTYKGNSVDNGNYVYQIQLELRDGEILDLTGILTVTR